MRYLHRSPPVAPGRFGAPVVSHRRDLVIPTRQGWTRSKNFGLRQNDSPAPGSRIAVISAMYREEFLIPFFLRHYWFADTIYILLGSGPAGDPSESLLKANPRVIIRPLDMPKGFDDGIKIDGMNAVVQDAARTHQWIIMADADEFIFPPGDPECKTIRDCLGRMDLAHNVLLVELYNVFRHKTDKDLDPTLPGPVVLQRRHGHTYVQDSYGKPSIARSNPLPQWEVGHHHVTPQRVDRKIRMMGVHWQMADPCFACIRRVRDRKERLSKRNLDNNWGTGNQWHTPEKIKASCDTMLDAPQVI